MAITKSAKKAARQNKKRRERNLAYLETFKKLVKDTRALAAQKKMDEVAKNLPKAYQALDKAAKAGVIKKNTA